VELKETVPTHRDRPLYTTYSILYVLPLYDIYFLIIVKKSSNKYLES